MAIESYRDPMEQCAGKNCPGVHVDRAAGTVTFEGAATAPAGMTPGPGETFVTMPLDVARRVLAEAGEL